MGSPSRGRRAARASLVQLLVVALVGWGMRPPAALAAPVDAPPRTGPRVAVFVVPLDPQARQHALDLEQAAEGAVGHSERFQLVPSQEVVNPTARTARAQKLVQAAELVKRGKQDLDDLEAGKAVEAFTEAVGLLKSADSTQDMELLLEAWVLKAAAHATAGDNDAAKKEIEALLPLDPKAQFSRTFFSPDLIKFAESQRRLTENAKGELTVRTEPAGARVWVDGQLRGTSPVVVAGLAAGKHLVAAAGQGSALAQVELSPGVHLVTLEPAELAPALKRAAGQVAADPDGPGRDAAARALGRTLQVDQLLVVEARKSPAGEQLEVTAVRVEVRDGHNAAFRQGLLKVGDEGAMTAFFEGLLQKDDPRDGQAPRTHSKEDGGSTAKTAAGFSLLGVGVAAVATGAVFGVMALNQSNQFQATPQTQVMKSDQLKSTGQTYAWVADVSFMVAAVTAIAGGALIISDRGSSAESAAPASASARKGLDPKTVEEDRRRAEQLQKRDAARRAEEQRLEVEARQRRLEQEAAAQGEEAKVKEEARLKAEAEEKAGAEEAGKKKSKKELKEEEQQRKQEEQRQKQEAEAAQKREAEEKRKAEQDKRQKSDSPGEPKKTQEDDLRNY